jgi:ubiquinone/menaquinone biosynthesis C-methylase UbiE
MYDAGSGIYGFLTTHDVWQRANQNLVRHFGLGTTGTPRICDMGCGTGATVIAEARACPRAEIVGVDISPSMIARAERAGDEHAAEVGARIRLMVADATSLPFDDASFDVVTGHSFLYLVPHRREVLREVARILRPGGRAIFMEPRDGAFSLRALLAFGKDPRFLTSMVTWRIASRMNMRFTGETLLATLEEAGLVPLTFEDVLGGLGVIGVAAKRA